MLMIMITLAGTGCHVPSENAGVLSANEAMTRVSEDVKVGAWVTFVKGQNAQDRAVVEVDSEDAAVYTVHVYEVVEDGGGMSHTATFGWYEVSKKTGAVTRIMP